jgi:hypothetical protein
MARNEITLPDFFNRIRPNAVIMSAAGLQLADVALAMVIADCLDIADRRELWTEEGKSPLMHANTSDNFCTLISIIMRLV